MGLPLILQLRRELTARRRSETSALLLALAGPLFGLLCLGVYFGAQECVKHSLPPAPLALGAVLLWIVAGIPGQIGLCRDRPWNEFVAGMPIRPAHLLAVHAATGLVVALAFCAAVLCGAAGLGAELFRPRAAVRWLAVAPAVVWVLAIQAAAALALSRSTWPRRLLILALLLWVLALAARVAWAVLAGRQPPAGVLLSDPLLVASGAVPLAEALLAGGGNIAGPCLSAAAHLGAVAAACALISWRLVRRVPPAQRKRPALLMVTRPVRGVFARLAPGPRAAQVAIEWLRTLRGRSTYITLYAAGSFIGAVLLRLYVADSNSAMVMLVLTGFLMAGDGTTEILRNRAGGRLYEVLGVDSGDYLLGFVTAVAGLITALCLVQIPILLDHGTRASTVLLVACTCAAAGLVFVPASVSLQQLVLDFRGGTVRRVLWTAKVGLLIGGVAMMLLLLSSVHPAVPLIVLALGFRGRTVRRPLWVVKLGLLIGGVAMVLLLLGAVHVTLPLVLAALFVAAEVRRARRGQIRRLYWRLDDG